MRKFRTTDGFEFTEADGPTGGVALSVADPSGGLIVLSATAVQEAAAWLSRPAPEAPLLHSNGFPTGWEAISAERLARADGKSCLYRLGRGYGPPIWAGRKWHEGVIAAPRRQYDLPQSHRDQTAHWRRGDPASVAIVGLERYWMEYAPDALGAEGIFTGDALGAADGNFYLQVLVESPSGAT